MSMAVELSLIQDLCCGKVLFINSMKLTLTIFYKTVQG